MTSDVASELASRIPALATDWAVNAEDLDLPYVAVGHLARRLIALANVQQALDCRPLFDDVEARLMTGDPAERNLLIVGFLEGLQSLDGRSGKPMGTAPRPIDESRVGGLERHVGGSLEAR